MNRILIACRLWAWCRTNSLHIERPVDVERICAPYRFKQFSILGLRDAIGNAGRIGQTHFYGIRGRPLRLLCTRALQAIPGRSHVPKVSAYKIALQFVVMQNRSKRSIHVTLGLAIAEAAPHRTGIRNRGQVQRFNSSIDRGNFENIDRFRIRKRDPYAANPIGAFERA